MSESGVSGFLGLSYYWMTCRCSIAWCFPSPSIYFPVRAAMGKRGLRASCPSAMPGVDSSASCTMLRPYATA
eukprot:10920340-Karenia_brevis.AAC.1